MDESDDYSSNDEGHYSDLATDCGASTEYDTDFVPDAEAGEAHTAEIINNIQNASLHTTAEVWRLLSRRDAVLGDVGLAISERRTHV